MKDAAMFPVYASGGLFGLYLFFKVWGCGLGGWWTRNALVSVSPLPSPQYLPKEYVNMILSVLFLALGIGALTRALRFVPSVAGGTGRYFLFLLLLLPLCSALLYPVVPSDLRKWFTHYQLKLTVLTHGKKPGEAPSLVTCLHSPSLSSQQRTPVWTSVL